MEMLSERYGWTPMQIREQRVDDLVAYLDIITLKNKIEKRQSSKKYGRK